MVPLVFLEQGLFPVLPLNPIHLEAVFNVSVVIIIVGGVGFGVGLASIAIVRDTPRDLAVDCFSDLFRVTDWDDQAN